MSTTATPRPAVCYLVGCPTKGTRDEHVRHIGAPADFTAYEQVIPEPAFGRASWRTLGDLVDELIELADEIEGAGLPHAMTGSHEVWVHTTWQIQEWLRLFANNNDLWHEPLPAAAASSDLAVQS